MCYEEPCLAQDSLTSLHVSNKATLLAGCGAQREPHNLVLSHLMLPQAVQLAMALITIRSSVSNALKAHTHQVGL